jgi:phage terminase large subunit GpA-like protein
MSSKATPDFLQTLRPDQLKTAVARRFADFCLQDFAAHANADGFDPQVYADAASLVIARLEATRHTEQQA